MITTVFLKHGATYHYKLHNKKKEELCTEFSPLKDFLEDVSRNCPHYKFLDGPRSSVLRLPVKADLFPVHSEVKMLARMGLESDYYGSGHMNVQMFMLAYDKKTVAVEIPIWMKSDELEGYKDLLGSEKPLTGHIDILRIEDGKIWVWDYKPNAHRERYAVTQIYFYALMLSLRTSIPLEKFMCGYFDDKSVFVFNPAKATINHS